MLLEPVEVAMSWQEREPVEVACYFSLARTGDPVRWQSNWVGLGLNENVYEIGKSEEWLLAELGRMEGRGIDRVEREP